MSNHRFTLFYWPVPFRGNFLRLPLVYGRASFEESYGFEEILEEKAKAPDKQLAPFMGPPLLIDSETGFRSAQTIAIQYYLGETLGLLPEGAGKKAHCLKVLADCLDILAGLTRSNGAQMWDETSFREFREERFSRWLQILAADAARMGCTDRAYFGSGRATLADLNITALLGTLGSCLPALRQDLEQHAPVLVALSDRWMQEPAIRMLYEQQARDWGDRYCGGQIEASIRAQLN